jgi:Mor family transcriptional regulator
MSTQELRGGQVVRFGPGRRAIAQRGFVSGRDERLIYFRELHGESYGELARRFGLTRQRIGAILQRLRPDLTGKVRPR